MSRLLLPTTFLLVASVILLAATSHAESLKNGGPVDITSQQLDVQQSKGTAVFTGNVVVVQSGFTLNAPTVTATYGDKSDKANAAGGIQSIVATGGVVITRPAEGGLTEKAVGSTAIYNPVSQQVVISGDVTLTRGPSQLSGDKLVYDMATGNARVTNSKGPVKARFVPGK